MITLMIAVFMASLLGSMHCACMCGPIAIWTSGISAKQTTQVNHRDMGKRISLYHAGRLITYLTLGGIAGAAGMALSVLGEGAGIQSAAARIAGVMMIAMGVWRLATPWVRSGKSQNALSRMIQRLSERWGRGVAELRKPLASLPLSLRTIGFGAITVLLPCGWLYLFVIVASGTGSVSLAMAVMFAFWVGSIPALIGVVTGWSHLGKLVSSRLPQNVTIQGATIVSAVVLIFFGLHTATGRASADLAKLQDRVNFVVSGSSEADAQAVKQISQEPLPCCDHGH